MTWLELKPETGRTHQIRVHCAAAGCPVIADRLYGRAEPGKLLHLHSRGIVLPLSKTKPPIRGRRAAAGAHDRGVEGLRLLSHPYWRATTQTLSGSPISKPAIGAARARRPIRSRPAAGAETSARPAEPSDRHTATASAALGHHVGQANDAVGAVEHAAGHDAAVAPAGEHREVRDRRTAAAGSRSASRAARRYPTTVPAIGHGVADPLASNSTSKPSRDEVERVEAVLDRPATRQVRFQQDRDGAALLGDAPPRRARGSRRWDRSAARARH